MGKRVAAFYNENSVDIVYLDEVADRGYFVLSCPSIDSSDEEKQEVLLNGAKYHNLSIALALAFSTER